MARSTGAKLGRAICEAVGLDPLKVGRLELIIVPGEYHAYLAIHLFLHPDQEEVIIRRFAQADWREDDGRRWEHQNFYAPKEQADARYRELEAQGWRVVAVEDTEHGVIAFGCERLAAKPGGAG